MSDKPQHDLNDKDIQDYSAVTRVQICPIQSLLPVISSIRIVMSLSLTAFTNFNSIYATIEREASNYFALRGRCGRKYRKSSSSGIQKLRAQKQHASWGGLCQRRQDHPTLQKQDFTYASPKLAAILSRHCSIPERDISTICADG